MRKFEEDVKREFGDRFWFLDKRRVDVGPTLTILGCTLWSRITDQAQDCARLLTDFHPSAGIVERSIDEHSMNHAVDLAWLNDQAPKSRPRSRRERL